MVDNNNPFDGVANNPLFSNEGLTPKSSESQSLEGTGELIDGRSVQQKSSGKSKTRGVVKNIMNKLGGKGSNGRQKEVRKQVRELNSQLESASAQVSNKKQQIRSLSRYQGLSAEISYEKEQLKQLAAQKKETFNARQDIQGKMQAIEGKEAELAEVNAKLANYRESMRDARSQVGSTKKQAQFVVYPDEQKRLQGKKESLTAEIRQAKGDLRALRQQFVGEDEEVMNQEMKVASLRTERKELIEKHVQPARKDWTQVNTQLQSLKENLKGQGLGNAKELKALNETQKQINQLFNENDYDFK